MAVQPMSLEEFRVAVFNRFRHEPVGFTEQQLSAELDPHLFNRFEEILEEMEQIRLITDELVKTCPAHDPDLVSLQKQRTVEVVSLWQRSILELPQAFIETAVSKPKP